MTYLKPMESANDLLNKEKKEFQQEQQEEAPKSPKQIELEMYKQQTFNLLNKARQDLYARNVKLPVEPYDDLLTVILDKDSRQAIENLKKTITSTSSNLQKALATTNENISDLMKLLDSSLIIDENSIQSNKSNENSNNNSAISLFSLVSDLTKSLQDQQDTNQKILDALKNNQL